MSTSFRSGPPKGVIKRIVLSGAALRNAICRPSGDQLGKESSDESVVRRTAVGLSIVLTYISKLSRRSPFQLKATIRPSGDRDGVSSIPGVVVNIEMRGAGSFLPGISHTAPPAMASPAMPAAILSNGEVTRAPIALSCIDERQTASQ